ncbi:MAG: AbrB/MazE/SpoVT family DNA-binding domain-containing protein [Candidatus Korarchaeum sp.]
MVEEVVKVTRNYQVTIPASIRSITEIKEGDFVKIIYDEHEGAIKIFPLKRRRTTLRVGREISVEEIEEAIEGMLSETASRY